MVGVEKPQLAYVTGKRVGPSVVRNRVRRRLRVIMADIAGDLAPGAYLVGAGPLSGELPFHDLRGNVWTALQHLGALRREDETFRPGPAQ